VTPAPVQAPAPVPAQPQTAVIKPAVIKPPPSVVVKPPAAPVAQPKTAQPKAPKAKAARPGAPANGRISSEVKNQATMRAIWTEHHQRDVSYEKIEQNPRFDLRHAKGMTAYRICRKYEKQTGTKRPKSKR
jgi:hypothetical protein